MKEITVYEASDGRRFNTLEDCIAYETSRELPKDIMKYLYMIKEMCKDLSCDKCMFTDAEGGCIFGGGDRMPSFWNFQPYSS